MIVLGFEQQIFVFYGTTWPSHTRTSISINRVDTCIWCLEFLTRCNKLLVWHCIFGTLYLCYSYPFRLICFWIYLYFFFSLNFVFSPLWFELGITHFIIFMGRIWLGIFVILFFFIVLTIFLLWMEVKVDDISNLSHTRH